VLAILLLRYQERLENMEVDGAMTSCLKDDDGCQEPRKPPRQVKSRLISPPNNNLVPRRSQRVKTMKTGPGTERLDECECKESPSPDTRVHGFTGAQAGVGGDGGGGGGVIGDGGGGGGGSLPPEKRIHNFTVGPPLTVEDISRMKTMSSVSITIPQSEVKIKQVQPNNCEIEKEPCPDNVEQHLTIISDVSFPKLNIIEDSFPEYQKFGEPRHDQMILTTIKTDFRGRRHSTSVSLNHLHKDETSSVSGNQNQVTVELQQNKEPRRRRRRHSIQGPSSRTRSPVRRVTRTPEKMSSTKGKTMFYQFLDLAVSN